MLYTTKKKYEEMVVEHPLRLKDNTTVACKDRFWFNNQQYVYLSNLGTEQAGIAVRVAMEMDVLLCMGYPPVCNMVSVCVPERCTSDFWRAYNCYKIEQDDFQRLKLLEKMAFRVREGRTDFPDNELIVCDNIERALQQGIRNKHGLYPCKPEWCVAGQSCETCKYNNRKG